MVIRQKMLVEIDPEAEVNIHLSSEHFTVSNAVPTEIPWDKTGLSVSVYQIFKLYLHWQTLSSKGAKFA